MRETSGTTSVAAGRVSATERNKRSSERHHGQDVGKRKKRAIQQTARRARRLQEKETIDSVSGVVGKVSARERNDQFSE
jgi:hypothetical protein